MGASKCYLSSSYSGKQRLIQGDSSGLPNTKSDDHSKDKTEILTDAPSMKVEMTNHDWFFINKRMNEEETQIGRIIMLEVSYFKRIVLVPILCILTCFIVFLFWFWSVRLKRALFFNKTTSINKATHLLIYGVKNHIEIVKIITGISLISICMFHFYYSRLIS